MHHQSSLSSERRKSHSSRSIRPLLYAAIGALFVVGISTNALQIQSSLRSAFQTIWGIFVTSGWVMPITTWPTRNVIFSINEWGNGSIRFWNLTGNASWSTVLILNPDGLVLQKPLSDFSGTLREILSGSLSSIGWPSNSTTISSWDLWNMISGSVRNEVLTTIRNNSGAIVTILSGWLKQLTRDYVFGSGGNGLDGQLPEICKQISRLCTNGRIATWVDGLSGIDGLMWGSGLTGPTGGMLYFNINRTTSRDGIPKINVWSETENLSTSTTVSDFIEWYFFPNNYLQASIEGWWPMPFWPNAQGTIDRVVSRSVTRNASTIDTIILTPGVWVSIIAVNGVPRTPTSLAITIPPTNPAATVPQNGTITIRFATNNANTYPVSITARDTKNKTASASTSFSRYRRVYAGLIDSTSPSAIQIAWLPGKIGLRSDLTTANASYTFTNNIWYRYVALPANQATWGNFYIKRDWRDVDMIYVNNTSMIITSPEWYETSYNIWRSKETQASPSISFGYQFGF